MYTFNKEERLCNKRLLNKLFHDGSSFILYPFRVVFLKEKLSVPFGAQVVIHVPKRNFKRAVDRNILKRRIREIYRLHKSDLLYSFLSHQQVLLGIGYIGKEVADYNLLDKKLAAAFEKLKQQYLES